MGGILVIDDAQIMRNLVRTILESKGYPVCGEASNGRTGVEKFRELKPDLVFCDIMMEEMDGVECLRQILAVDPRAAVVICTAAGDELHNAEALTAGARAFITKPVRAAEVLRVTESIIGPPKASYKKMMEERAEALGIEAKQVLDFFEAFRQFSGVRFDDPKVDAAYLKENGESIGIGARALLAAKMTQSQADRVMDIYLSLFT